MEELPLVVVNKEMLTSRTSVLVCRLFSQGIPIYLIQCTSAQII